MSVDSDGSNQTLVFRGKGPVRAATLVDDDATAACETGGPATARGPGDVSDDGGTIAVTFKILRCEDGTRPLRDVDVDFVHDADTDTLTDSFGVVWSRP